MKKNLFIISGIVALSLLASCALEKDEPVETPTQPEEQEYIFTVSAEEPSEVDTKVYADKNLTVRWNQNDSLTVFVRNDTPRTTVFQGKDGDRSGTLKYSASFNQNRIDKYAAIYPYSKNNKLSYNSGDMTFKSLSAEIPTVQHYAANSFGKKANVMAAISDNNDFKFKNLGGFLSIKLYGEGVSVKSVSLEANAIEPIAGPVTITFNEGLPVATLGKEATNRVTLVCDEPVALNSGSADYKEFWFAIAPTTFSKGFTVEVTDTEGKVMRKSTKKAIEIKRNRISRMAPFEVQTETPDYIAVDLGLPSGIKWAASNVGTFVATAFGDYFAWGETETKTDYSWNTYKWGTSDNLTKYNSSDNKMTLDPDDDAATANMGEGWRTPTIAEFNELIKSCTWEDKTVNGIDGCLVTGSNGNYIFLPNARCYSGTNLIAGQENNTGMYWTNTCKTYSGWPRAAFLSMYKASRAIVSGDPVNEAPENFGHLRSLGMTVRAVMD